MHVLPALAVTLASLSLVVGLRFPRPPKIGTTDLGKVGCAYISDVGDSHGFPVSACTPLSSSFYGDEGLARFRVRQLGVSYTLRLRFAHSAWQVTAAEDK